MPIAAKWGDPVIGIDIHMVMVPAPPSPIPVPTPMPHAFVGVVYDPLGAAISVGIGAAGGGGLVLINYRPVGNTGTDVRGNGHAPTPPGVSFAPNDIPDNKGTIVTGSKTVSMGGSSAGRLTSMVISCNYPVNLPTSVCLSVPMGAPVLIGGPDSFDVMAAVGRGIRTKWFSDKLHKVFKIKPGTRLSKTICFLTGHPVDVMTGEVSTDAVDFELPGPILLRFERSYSSRDTSDGPFGPGWQHPLNVWVQESGRRVVVRLPDGRERMHKALAPGASLWDDVDRYWLKRTERGYLLTMWHGRSYELEPVAKAAVTCALVRVSDRSENEVVCRYRDGRLYEVTDSAGRLVRFAVESGRLAAVRLRRSEGPREGSWMDLVRYAYEDGRLVAAIDPNGQALRYAYESGVLVRETNRNGLTFYFEYDWNDPEGWCVRTWGDGGIYDRRITYDKHRHMTIVDDSRGGRTHYWGNAVGLVEREIDPTGCERRYEWDEACRKVAEVDGLGHRTEWVYDERGNMVLERDALGGETRLRFNELNLPVEVVDAAGGVWRRVYDRRGLLGEEMDPLGNVTRFFHNRRGSVVSVQDPLGSHARFQHNERGDLSERTDYEGGTTRYAVSEFGRLLLRVDALGRETRFVWDVCGRLERIERPDGLTICVVRDAEGNVVERTDALGNKTCFRYGGMNRLIEQVDPLGGVVRFAYDTEEDLVGMTNELGEEYRFEVDKAGRFVKEIGFDGRRLERWYDRAGRSRETVNAAGERTAIERDALGRIIKLRAPGPVSVGHVRPGIEEIDYGYDALGQLIRTKNGSCEVLFERDALGRVVKEKIGEHWIESRYDAGGRRVGRKTSLGHETGYEVDGNGALLGLVFGLDSRWNDFSPETLSQGGPPVKAPWRVAIGRDALGMERERTLPGGIVSYWSRDRFGRPAVHRVLRGEEQISAMGYRWCSDEQIAALIDTKEGPTQFTHDARSYLVAATQTDGAVQFRVPDAVGNVYRTAARVDRSYGPGGRLMEADGTRYVHGADGQVMEKVLPDGKRWKYAWDGEGQLVEVVRPDGREVSFAYDPLGRRISKTFGGRTTFYLWDGNDLVHELTNATELVTWEIEPGTFAVLAKVEGEKRYGVVTDHLGTPKVLFDEAGAIAWKAQLDLYGVAKADVLQTRCSWRWPGQYEDEETGLYYNRFRYYDPETGTYIQQDPIGLEGGYALYGYVRDPLASVDPLGLSESCTKIYRGTRLGLEREIFQKTRLIMSDAARRGYMEAIGKGMGPRRAIAAARKASEAAHLHQIGLWGSLEQYVQAHCIFGTEISKLAERSMISFTTDPRVAEKFRDGGVILSGKVAPGSVLSQTFPGTSEAEVLALHMISLL